MTEVTQNPLHTRDASPLGRADDALPASAGETIAALRAQHREVRLAEARELALAARYAEQCSSTDATAVVLPGCETLTQLAGDGTPKVAEFAGLELAMGLGVPADEAHALMTSALAIKHRLPGIWRLTMDAVVPVWLARKLSMTTRDLDILSSLTVDEELAKHAAKVPAGRLLAMADGLVLASLEPAVAEKRKADAADSRGVWFEPRDGGVTAMNANLSSADALFLEASVARMARILSAGGSTENLDARRATGLGLLASPARALQFLQADLLDEVPDLFAESEVDPACPARGQRGHTCGQVTVSTESLLPKTRLYVHLTDAALRDGAGVCRVEGGIKPVLVGWLKDLLGDAKVHVTPVLDVEGLAPVDAYEVPARMREALEMRNPYGVEPWSNRRSRGLDMDHTIPYQHGDADSPAPPLQTRVSNLGPLSRRWHRAKTHGGYEVTQLADGVFLWRSPMGQRMLVTPSGTRCLEPALPVG